jgi:plasmid stabilization system protein ParE
VPPEVAEQREIRSLIECLERESDPARALRQIRLLEVRILKAKLRNPLLTEENSRYFDKIVARMTLAGDPR